MRPTFSGAAAAPAVDVAGASTIGGWWPRVGSILGRRDCKFDGW